MTETTETMFVCVDCDCDVYVWGFCPEGQSRCSTCQWLAALPDAADRERVRAWLTELETTR